jgi:hypothetical protein
MLFCSVSVYGSQATIPTRDIEMNLTLSSKPQLGDEFIVSFTFTPREDIAHKNELNDEAHIWVPHGIELVSGSSTWEGRLQKGKTETIQIIVKTTQPGSYTFHGVVNSCQIDPSHIPSDPSLEQRIGRQVEEKAFAFRNVVSEKMQIGEGEEGIEIWSIDASTGEAKKVKMKGQFPSAPPSIANGQLRVVGVDSSGAERLDNPRTEEKTITGSSPGDSPSSTLAELDQKEVTFEKVQEKTYKEFIRDIAFGSAFKEGEERVYPKIIVFEDEVQFLDENEEIISRKSLVVNKPKEIGKYFGKEVILSGKGNFAAVHEYTGEFGEVEYIVEEELTIFSPKGEEMYKIYGPLPGTDENSVFLMSDEDGSIIRTRIAYGMIDFYDPSGEARSIPIFGEIGWRRRTAAVSFSGDGEYLAILVSEEPKRRDPKNPFKADLWLLLYDTKGNELWRRKVDDNRAGSVAISGKGEYITIKAFTPIIKKPTRERHETRFSSFTSAIYDRQGNKRTIEAPFASPRDLFVFSPDANCLAIGAENAMKLIEIEKLSIVFEKEFPEDSRVRRMVFSPGGSYLVIQLNMPPVSQGKRVRSATEGFSLPRDVEQVLIYDELGIQVFQSEARGLRHISFSGKYLILRYAYGYELYERIN